MILETVVVGPMQVNCYILACAEAQEAVIIDPGAEERKISRVLEKYRLKPAMVVNTHGHYDHIGCDDKFGVPVYVHKLDAAMLSDGKLNLSFFFALPYQVKARLVEVADGQVLQGAGISLQAMHIPGHTPGGMAFLLQGPGQGAVFSGDTLFRGGIGRSDLAGGDGELLVKKIKEKLLVLPGETKVYPGHGPASTIAGEKKDNPFL